MPISGPSSYVPTMNAFITHWAQANQVAPGGAIVLAGNVAVAGLATRRTELSNLRDIVTDAGVDRALRREELTTLITRLQGRLVEFNGRVRADLPGHPLARVLPEAFSVGDAEGPVRDGLRQVMRLWAKVNAITPAPAGVTLPMLLMGGYAVADLEADREALRNAFGALTEADVNLRVARETRNDLQDVIYAILKAYRAKLPTVFPAGHAVLDSLPTLTPASGHTPDAVTAAAVWDGPSTKAKVTWSASTDADLSHYEVRGNPGEPYVAADETVLASVAPADAREFLTDFALSVPGVTAGFKVYVVLHTGNERGSEAVYVTRPV
jgi:hypothetical protein